MKKSYMHKLIFIMRVVNYDLKKLQYPFHYVKRLDIKSQHSHSHNFRRCWSACCEWAEWFFRNLLNLIRYPRCESQDVSQHAFYKSISPTECHHHLILCLISYSKATVTLQNVELYQHLHYEVYKSNIYRFSTQQLKFLILLKNNTGVQRK